MALALTLLAVNKGLGPYIDAEVLFTPSGSYTAGGDTANLTTLYAQTDPAGRSIDSDQLPVYADVTGLGAVAGSPALYQFRSYTNPADGTPAVPLTPATCLLQVFAGVTEASTTTYINGVLSDRIVGKLTFKSQQ